MRLEIDVVGTRYRTETDRAVSLAIPLHFDGPQPSFFGASPASATAMRVGSWEGDTRRGAGCNVRELRLNPHCNGTHTESIAHVVDELVPVHLDASVLCPATVLSIVPTSSAGTRDTYSPPLGLDDWVIERRSLEARLEKEDDAWLEALVVRTLPNVAGKKKAAYGDALRPPFFTRSAAEYLRTRGVAHLVVDLPSLDKTDDEGRLTAHHVFFGLPEGTRTLPADHGARRTLTELAFVPDIVADGHYLLNLQLPAFELDAAPSRPLLLPLEAL